MDRPRFGLGVRASKARLIITVRGACDESSRSTLRTWLEQLKHDTVLDLRDCCALDAATVELLVETHRRLRAKGRSFAVANVPPHAQQVIARCGADQVLTVEAAVPAPAA